MNIESKIKNQMQGSNIKDILLSLGRQFGVKLEYDSDDLKALIQYSADRNLMTHNSGIVNRVYLSVLQSNQIVSAYSIGQRIILADTYVKDSRKIYRKIIAYVSKTFIDSTDHIYQYYQGKYGIYP